MIDPDRLDWAKGGGLLPAIVQDRSGMVLMLGYMCRDALESTLASGLVTFFSRSKGRLWVKGERSGNRLRLIDVTTDCDRDTLLVRADPEGPTCHTGTASCFATAGPFFPSGMEAIVRSRASADPATSYTARLAREGVKRMAQKVGEEGVEVALAAVQGDRDELVAEVADLVFHLTLLLQTSNLSWNDISVELERRHHDREAIASS
jgi:phosphoribosyl-ATP pyrophosphohydrolase/phosphoribosyl-AMP cyclohydrolase